MNFKLVQHKTIISDVSVRECVLGVRMYVC